MTSVGFILNVFDEGIFHVFIFMMLIKYHRKNYKHLKYVKR